MSRQRKPFWIDYELKRLHGQSPLEWGGIEWDLPLNNVVADNLIVGGVYHNAPCPPEVRHIISLFPWQEYDAHPLLGSYLSLVFSDDESQDLRSVSILARWVNECRRSGPVLVHCQAGLNRSALVAATALVVGPEHLTGPEALALLRLKRHRGVLCNPHFERYLTGMDHEQYLMEPVEDYGSLDPRTSGRY